MDRTTTDHPSQAQTIDPFYHPDCAPSRSVSEPSSLSRITQPETLLNRTLSDSCLLSSTSISDATHNYMLPLLKDSAGVKSPYAPWFEGVAIRDLSNYLKFETFGAGLPLKFSPHSAWTTENMRSIQGNRAWQSYFAIDLPKFRETVLTMLNLPQEWLITDGANTTEFLNRMVSTLCCEKTGIISTDKEFNSVTRFLSALNTRQRHQITTLSFDAPSTLINKIACQLEARDDIRLIIVSQVFSNTQISLTEDEVKEIVSIVPTDCALLFDVTQGIGNVPMNWGSCIGDKENVYMVGTFIKHGRAGEGVRFLASRDRDLLATPTLTGWTARLSELNHDIVDVRQPPAFDPNAKWRGGTPANHSHLNLAYQTWNAIFSTGQTITSMHRYTQSIINYFLDRIDQEERVPLNRNNLIDWERREMAPEFASNALSFRDDQAEMIVTRLAEQGVHIDSRRIKMEDGSEESILRIGFGVEHGIKQVDALIDALKN